ncbi:MAG: dimethyl sulfoxide reductase anchor subunit [Anaerolineales bacterium]|nr:dimethyl sulfoxide reductase anchor subunit [Anaerolineales bacterium]
MQSTRQHAWPLVFFTLLTQAAAGAFFWWGLAVLWLDLPVELTSGGFARTLLAVVLALLAFGTLAATLHLGQPGRAWLSLSHLRASWLSREALLGGSFGFLVLLVLLRSWQQSVFGGLENALVLLGLLAGAGLVYGISRLYRLRTVPAWDHAGTPAAFFITALLLGLVTITALWLGRSWFQSDFANEAWLNLWLYLAPLALIVLTVLQWGTFSLVLLSLSHRGGAAVAGLRLLATELRRVLVGRALAAFLALVLLAWPPFTRQPLLLGAALALLALSEILGRYLFYAFYRRVGI